MAQLVFDVFLFVTDWFLGVLFVHKDVENVTGTLDQKWIFLYFNIFHFIFDCATVELD